MIGTYGNNSFINIIFHKINEQNCNGWVDGLMVTTVLNSAVYYTPLVKYL